MPRPGLDSDPAAGPRVLLVGVDLSGGGGVNKVISDLALLLSRDLGCSVTVASARSGAAPSYPLPAGVALEAAPEQGRGPLAYLAYLISLRHRRFDFAIGFWAQDNVALAAALLGSRTRVVLCEHNSWFTPPPWVRALRRAAYRWAHRVTVLNRAELEHYRRYLDNVTLLPNPLHGPGEVAAGSREKLIIGVGHLIPRKGFADLVRAFARSGLAGQGWHLAIIGEGEQGPLLESVIAEQAPGSAQIVAPTDDIAAWYRRAAIIAVSSDVEVFSLVLAEAIQAGVAPVAYAADGPAFILEEFPEQLVPIGDVDALAQALARTAAADRAALGELVRKSLNTRMAWAQVAAQWRTILGPNEA